MFGIISGFGAFLAETVGGHIIENLFDFGSGKAWDFLKNEYHNKTCYESKMLHVVEEAVDKSIINLSAEARDNVCLAVLYVLINDDAITPDTLKKGLKDYERKYACSIPDKLKSNPVLLCDSLNKTIGEDEELYKEILLRTNFRSVASGSKIEKELAKLKEGQEQIKDSISEKQKSENNQSSAYDFSEYYEYIKKKFTRKKSEGAERLVGDESDEKAYIDAFISYQNTPMQVLRYLEKWFNKDDSGTVLIHGEPGHGKSTLCNKAVFEHAEGNFLSKDKNVITISLNPGKGITIFENGQIKLENALVWGGANHKFSFKDCRGALLFMDGFDEFIDIARDAGIKNIISFLRIARDIADENDIHIVVLSRTTAVERHLDSISGRSFQLLPITEDQQDIWLEQHTEYDDYRNTFNSIREDKNMNKLLGVPLLFRLIVHNRFNKVSSNIVELYDNLFLHLMDKRGIQDEKQMSVSKNLMDLAYDIYCTDTNIAVVNKEDLDKDWVFTFYLTVSEIKNGSLQSTYKVGFYHRTFYQYFLAKYIYCNLLNITNNNVKKFIGYYAERELDVKVRDYLSLMLKETDKEAIYSKMDIVINALVETEGFLNLIPKYSYGNAERSRIFRVTFVFWNVMHIAAAFSYVIKIPFKDNLDILLKVLPCYSIKICSDANKKADLSDVFLPFAELSDINLKEANLVRAYLSHAQLSWADLRGANLSGADLTKTVLLGANLEEANLSVANMVEADLDTSNLSGANLSGAKLSGANLSRANLSGANLKGADLTGAYLSGANLKEADLLGADLSLAQLMETDMRGVNLVEVNLIEADLRGSILVGTDLRGANLSGADLRKALLIGTDIRGTDLSEANLSGAYLIGVRLIRSDLEEGKRDNSINMVANLYETTIEKRYKELIHSNILGYESIKWIDDVDINDLLAFDEE